MKKVVLLLAVITAIGAAHAEGETDDPAQSYIANLCTIVMQEKSSGSADSYIARLKTLTPPGDAASPQQEDTAFDEDEARTVVAAWMNLNEDQKKVARQNQQTCQNATWDEYQSQD